MVSSPRIQDTSARNRRTKHSNTWHSPDTVRSVCSNASPERVNGLSGCHCENPHHLRHPEACPSDSVAPRVEGAGAGSGPLSNSQALLSFSGLREKADSTVLRPQHGSQEGMCLALAPSMDEVPGEEIASTHLESTSLLTSSPLLTQRETVSWVLLGGPKQED